MVVENTTTPALRIDIGRTDVWSCLNRQPIGYLTLSPPENQQLQHVDMRVSLLDATLSINLTTNASDATPISVTIFFNAADPLGETGVLVAQTSLPATACGFGQLMWNWTADTSGVCANTSVQSGRTSMPWGDAEYCTQYTPNGTYSTAFTIFQPSSCEQTLVLTVANSQRQPSPQSSQADALATLRNSVPQLPQIYQQHAAWWLDFWQMSFISFDSAGLPDVTRLETFTHIASFRYAMAARFTMSDLMGPWGPAHSTQCIGPWCQFVWDVSCRLFCGMLVTLFFH